MNRRVATMLVCAIAMLGFAVSLQGAEEAAKTQTGTVVSATASQIVVKNAAGEQQTLKLADVVSVTVDGKEAKAADVKAGMKVTTTANEAGNVTKVVATSAKPNVP